MNQPLRAHFCFETLEERRLLSAGAIDATFGTHGVASTSLLAVGDAAVQSDGKIVVAGGKIGRNGANDLALVRFNANGSLDGAFGSGGITVTPVTFGGNLLNSSVTGVSVLSNGKIVVAGLATPPGFDGTNDPWNLVVARYNSNGALDTTFGTAGESILQTNSPAPGFVQVGHLAVLGDGTIVVTADEHFQGPSPETSLVAAFSASGKPDKIFDPQFVQGGSPIPNFVQINPNAVAALPGNKFVVAGVSDNNAQGLSDEALVVLNEQGSANPVNSAAFVGASGKQPVLSAEALAVAAVPGNKLILAGDGQVQSGNAIVSGFALSQYTASGAIDSTFNGGTKPYGPGTTLTPLNGGGSATLATVEPGGKILLAGDVPVSPGSSQLESAIVRYNVNGSLDTTFGTGGKVVTNSIEAFPNALLVQPGGKIVLVGSANGHVELVRLQGDSPATVSGTVFNDKNSNGVQNSGEAGLAGVQVYADLEYTGSYVAGDPNTTTNSQGKYTLAGLIPGQYVIRQVPPKGYHQTAPPNEFGLHLSVLAGQTLTAQNFGDVL